MGCWKHETLDKAPSRDGVGPQTAETIARGLESKDHINFFEKSVKNDLGPKSAGPA